MLLQMTGFPSILKLNNITVSECVCVRVCITFSLSIHLLLERQLGVSVFHTLASLENAVTSISNAGQ